MARRRYFRPGQNFQRGPRVNDQIRKSPIRLIDEDDNMLGVVETSDALYQAREAGLDLVEVAADSDPPVCRILDYGKYRYELSKKEKANKQKSKLSEIKEVRLGRSMKIDPHDIEIRLRQARKFLIEGYKVQIVQNFRGREMIHRDRGYTRMKDIMETLSDIAKVEMSPRQNGRRMSMLLTPDKTRIDQLLKKEKAASDAKAGNEKEIESTEATAPVETAPAPVETAPAPTETTPAPENGPVSETTTT